MNYKSKLYGFFVKFSYRLSKRSTITSACENKKVHIFCPGKSSESFAKNFTKRSKTDLVIGINGFIFHPLSCDFYFWEASKIKKNRQLSIEKLQHKKYQEILIPHQSKKYDSEVCILKNHIYYETIPYASHKYMILYNLKNFFHARNNIFDFYGSGSTLMRAVNLAIKNNASEVHIYGLDLDNNYIEQIRKFGYNTLQTENVHLTESKAKILKITEYFSFICLLKDFGAITSNIYYYGTNEKLKKMLASS